MQTSKTSNETVQTPLQRLRHHVTGAIERGEATPIVEQTASAPPEKSAHTKPDRTWWTYWQYNAELDKVTAQRDQLLAACKHLVQVVRTSNIDRSATSEGLKNCDAISVASAAISSVEGKQ